VNKLLTYAVTADWLITAITGIICDNVDTIKESTKSETKVFM